MQKFVDLGRITSIEYNHKPLEVAKIGQDVCIKIENTGGGAPKLLGRHFLIGDQLVSKVIIEILSIFSIKFLIFFSYRFLESLLMQLKTISAKK